MMQPLNVSVVIPTFNRPALLAQAVKSVLNQTCPALEIIIIDNGSGSGCLSELSKIADSHDSIVFTRLETNKGPGFARNLGIEKSRGDWILFLDDDDLIGPDFIGTCLESIRREKDAEMVMTRAFCFTKGRLPSYPRDAIGAVNLGAYQKDRITTMLLNGITIGSCLIRKDLIGPIRFKEDIWHGEDTIFWFMVMQKVKILAINDVAFSGVRQHQNQMTLKNIAYNPDGSPSLPKETYVGAMLDSMRTGNSWHEFTMKVIFRRIADGVWYSPSIIALLSKHPFYAVKILKILVGKRLYRYAVMMKYKIFKNQSPDFTWIQN